MVEVCSIYNADDKRRKRSGFRILNTKSLLINIPIRIVQNGTSDVVKFVTGKPPRPSDRIKTILKALR